MGIVQSHGKTDSEIYNQNELLRSQNQELKKQIKLDLKNAKTT